MKTGRVLTLLRRLAGANSGEEALSRHLGALTRIAVAEHLDRHLYQSARYREPGRLNRHEFQVYSQSGEDGILEEIFDRVGAGRGFFVEFGAGDGLTNNTVYRLARGWQGRWLEASPARAGSIREIHRDSIGDGRLAVRESLVTAENVETLFREEGVPEEPDLLSVDIDGNDFWVWKSIERFRPRVVVIEYNASYPPGARWVRPYDPGARWDGTQYFGASLKALQLLGEEKGYQLVGCSFSGVNAFFVRKDIAGDRFCSPFTAENHYEPPRYHLILEPHYRKRFAPGVERGFER